LVAFRRPERFWMVRVPFEEIEVIKAQQPLA
jgi:hypothetical protein